MNQHPVKVSYFSDVLCIWAYIAQARVDQLKKTFQDKLDIDYHFISIFGDVERKLANNWKDRGGASGYSEHVRKIVSTFEHIEIHPKLWTQNRPKSSGSCHLFLKAVQLYAQQNNIDKSPNTPSLMQEICWNMRLAFFKDCIDIAQLDNQIALLEKLNLPAKQIIELMYNGEAFAELNFDIQLASSNHITGSPTFLFNEGRQKLYGNIGYRLIEANIQELINKPENQASWC